MKQFSRWADGDFNIMRGTMLTYEPPSERLCPVLIEVHFIKPNGDPAPVTFAAFHSYFPWVVRRGDENKWTHTPEQNRELTDMCFDNTLRAATHNAERVDRFNINKPKVQIILMGDGDPARFYGDRKFSTV
jgi:hypothetical protein